MSRITNFLAQRFFQNAPALEHYGELLSEYECSGLAPPHLAMEVTSGDEGKLWACVWEAMLYCHLTRLGFGVRGCVKKSGQHGPDFGITHEGQTIWIEAVTPSPQGIPQDHLIRPRAGEVKQRIMPHKEMLLRWTSVLRDKRKKLEAYANEGFIAPTDCTVIAVNSCRLEDMPINDLGISQFPVPVEVAFAIGPLVIPITLVGGPVGEPRHSHRLTIRKPSGKDVSTGIFLDSRYANISAIMGCYRKDMAFGPLPLTLVHNPLATMPLHRKILGASKEYVSDDKGDYYEVRRLAV